MTRTFPLFLLLGIGILSCRPHPPEAPGMVATVNGDPITEMDFIARLRLELPTVQTMDSKEFNLFKRGILEKMTLNALINRWAAENKVVLTSEEVEKGLQDLKSGYTDKEFQNLLTQKGLNQSQWEDTALQNLLIQKALYTFARTKIQIAPQEINKYYREHATDFETKERVRVRHIVTDSKEKAEDLRAKIVNGENFAELAITHSLSPDRSQGGDLGYFERGTYPKEFDAVCFKLERGELSPVIQSPYGFHLFKLIDKKPPGLIPLAQAREQIASNLLQQKSEKATEAWLAELKTQARVETNEAVLKRITPAQMQPES